MAAFQILNKDKEAMIINQIDEEVAQFWGKEVHKKNYCNPSQRVFTNPEGLESIKDDMIGNWFDQICWYITSCKEEITWENVLKNMLEPKLHYLFKGNGDNIECTITYSIDKKDFDNASNEQLIEILNSLNIDSSDKEAVRVFFTEMYYKPYIELVQYWSKQGYTPLKVD